MSELKISQFARGFASGCRYMLARYWDYIERGGGLQGLRDAVGEVVEMNRTGDLPDDRIPTTRGVMADWEEEFETVVGRFGITVESLKSARGRPRASQMDEEGDSEWPV